MPDTPEIRYIQENIPKSTTVMGSASDFYSLKDFRNFLDYSDQIKFGLTLRNETLSDFLDRMDPEVIYLPEITYSPDILDQFIEHRNFISITPNLWVSQELLIDK